MAHFMKLLAVLALVVCLVSASGYKKNKKGQGRKHGGGRYGHVSYPNPMSRCDYVDCNYGVCKLTKYGTQCVCRPGYTGKKCDKPVDPCDGVDCNYGWCEPRGKSYQCVCQPGYQGRFCDVKVDPCDNVDCGYGTCVPDGSSYYCDCDLGFEGKNCDTNTDDCWPNPCKNGGKCTDLVNDFKCHCRKHYSGNTCSVYY